MDAESQTGTNDVESVLEQGPAWFFAEMGREMEAALASIIESSERIADDPERAEAWAGRLQGQGAALRRIFRSLNHLALLQQNGVESSAEPFDLVEGTKAVLESMRTSSLADGLTLILEAPERPLELAADEEAVQQVLRHLVANAISFTPDGEVTVRLEAADDEIVVRIEDTGMGLPAEALPDVFDAFEQHAPEEHNGHGGIGLGLTLAEALVHQMEGAIDVDTDLEAGTAFTVRMPGPVSTGDTDPDDATEEHAEDARDDARLLILEDNQVTRKLLHRMLETEYQVDMVAQADEAMQHVEDHSYDALILDINLGGRRTGVEVLHEVRRMEQYTSIPAVACTAYALDGHRDQFLQVGFNEVVTKPVTKRELFRVIEQLLRESPPAPTNKIGEISSGVELPPISTTLIQVTDLISQSSDSHNIEALTRVLEKDQVVSFWLLRHVNSAFYGISESVDTVERAVRYLGFRPVCNLVLTKVMARNFSDREGPGPMMMQQYVLKTSSLAAFLSRALAEQFELDAPKIAYTAGLIAQLGRLAMLTAEGETYVDLWFEGDERTEEAFKGPPPRGQEILHCEGNYLQKGVAVGKACKLSEELVAVLRAHPHPLEAEAWAQPLVTLVSLALDVAYGVYDPEGNAWDSEDAFLEAFQDADTVHFLAEQEDLSLEEVTYALVESTEEAQEFVSNVLSET